MTLTFLGAAGTVTGSKYLLTLGERRVLVDAGLFQGEKEWREKNWQKFPVEPSSISEILLTHAHLDHCGFIPALAKHGFSGTIWATADTIALAEIVLRDSAYLQEMDARDAAEGGWSKHNPPLPLYTTDDVERTLPLFREVAFDDDLDLGDDLVVRYTRAGHILGSASIRVAFEGTSVLFSGDLGRLNHPVLRPRETPPGADYVVMESTYGDREHAEPEGLPHELFAATIRRTIKRGGSVLVPAFAIDRTEGVLKALTELRHANRIPDVPIFVNSPMGIRALAVYQTSGELRPDLKVSDFVDLPNLTTVETADESRALNSPTAPCIIITSSGMATGGRVLHHLQHMLPDHRHSVVFTGFQGSGTRGRALIEGAKQLKMRGQYVPVRATIVQDTEFSVHADRSELLDWVRGLEPKPVTVFAAHGDPESAAAFCSEVTKNFGIAAVVPKYGEVVRVTPGSRPEFEAVTPVVEQAAPVAVGELVVTPTAVVPPTAAASSYRLLTGRDDAVFCHRVSRALEEGYELYGSPTLTFDGSRVIAGQAVVWPKGAGAPPVTAASAPVEKSTPTSPARRRKEPTGQED
ncbi:MAG TPA: DUF1737 domain-containing protein [Propionibacteriaceae bacterium]|nr:DUF1737 domain-containing protein [Propionibacteriaceae bacterium]